MKKTKQPTRLPAKTTVHTNTRHCKRLLAAWTLPQYTDVCSTNLNSSGNFATRAVLFRAFLMPQKWQKDCVHGQQHCNVAIMCKKTCLVSHCLRQRHPPTILVPLLVCLMRQSRVFLWKRFGKHRRKKPCCSVDGEENFHLKLAAGSSGERPDFKVLQNKN